MKNIFSKIIMNFIVILMFGVFTIFGILIYQEITYKIKDNYEVSNGDTTLVFGEENGKENITTPGVIESSVELDTNSTSTEVDYNNVNIDKYFYNQLNNYSKTIYKALESNKEEMKTGTHQIELGTSFTDLLSSENGDTLLGEYYQSAIEAYTYDNVDIFYFDVNRMFLNIETTTRGKKSTYNVFINTGSQSSYLLSSFTSKDDVDNSLLKIQRVRDEILQNKKSDVYSNIKMVHDYLINNLEYDTSISGQNIYNLYGGLVEKRCVCEGYAKSFKYMMDALGVPCTLVIGKATNSEGSSENHEWNYVQLKGTWYAIDCTWDDPIVVGGGTLSNSAKYKYFLKGSSEFNQNHFPDGHFTPNGMEFSYPTISSNNY